jgi:hypothetical protein
MEELKHEDEIFLLCHWKKKVTGIVQNGTWDKLKEN